MAGNFNINQIQSYIKQKRSEYISLTKPGYEIYFYSRFNTTADVIPYLNNGGAPTTMGTQGIPTMQSGQITPNAILSSNVTTGDVASVISIKISNTVVNQTGSTAEIVIANPQGVDYFNRVSGTVGLNSGAQTDYDFSRGKPISLQRIGDEDTVLIRLKNAKTSISADRRFDSETVFRGVIKNIHRVTSPTGGALLVIELGDFSEVLRNFTALPLGIFSTVSFSITGRGLVNNLIRYANRLTTGDWRFLGQNVSQAFANAAEGAAESLLNQNGLSVDQNAKIAKDAQNAGNHKMDVPIFFYLEYSNQYPDIQAPINSSQQEQILSASAGNDEVTPPSQDTKAPNSTDLYNQLTTAAYKQILNAIQASGFKQTPEDSETIASYQVALQKAANSSLNKYSSSLNVASDENKGIEQYAWIFADLYLDKGLITFEHKKLWNTMTETAARSMREVYFDFAPKLSPTAQSPYDTATVPQYNQDKSLPDLHPNVGIVKYRLSPSMLAYDENNNSQIFQWSINDEDMLDVTESESSEEVFTAVFGFGSQLDPASLGEKAKDIFVGQNKGLLAFAQSIDPNIESRIGYRFMTDHDQKIRIPILMYLTSYALLMQSEMNMFTAQIRVLGNPSYRPGSIIRLKDRRMDYYCTDVVHNWSMSDGYTTTLILAYGHTSGILPAPLTGGYLNDNNASNEQCQLRAKALSKYISQNVNIGGVNAHCLVSAMWQFMTCGAPTDEAMQQATPEFEDAGPHKINYSDWIQPFGWNASTTEHRGYSNLSTSYSPIPSNYNPPVVSTYIPIIKNYITLYGLDAYNVTPNLVMNILRQESGFYADALNSVDGGLGWFQLTCPQQYPANPAQLFTSQGKQVFQQNFSITVQDAVYNFDKACSAAVLLLAGKFKSSAYTKKGNTGDAFLLGLGAYNGDVSSNRGPSYTYQRLVLGDAQVNAIIAGTQIPNGAQAYSINSGLTCQPAGPNLPKWPYKVYGPIGERLDTYKSRHSGITDKVAKQNLSTFSTGMTEAVTYITGLLTKYNSAALPGCGVNGNPTASVNGNDLMQKVITAWFSNENVSSLQSSDSDFLGKAISGIKKAYQDCRNCTGQTAASAVGQDLSKNLAVSQIDWRYPCDNSTITSPFGETGHGSPPHVHKGIDVVNLQMSGQAFPAYAPADGYIISAGSYGAGSGNGLNVVMLHSAPNHGIISRFLDVDNLVQNFQPGDKIVKGQLIGYASTTARESSAPHIHMEIRIGATVTGSGSSLSVSYPGGYLGGQAVDPSQYCKK